MKQTIISQAHKLLLKSGKTIAVAESCTGGILSSFLTLLPGSSKYFILGAITYSNKTKENILGISPSVISKNGAVSAPVAQLMAQKARRLAKADFGIGITGIAGPTGGSPQKPVGTVFIAISSNNKSIYRKFKFTGTRSAIRKKAALGALKLLHENIYRD
ncbi:MAG: CinA family protein [Candidatus Omnitrophica bacterium]|nr:CinA family protein [Candidatus Omnitrophota bacterium]